MHVQSGLAPCGCHLHVWKGATDSLDGCERVPAAFITDPLAKRRVLEDYLPKVAKGISIWRVRIESQIGVTQARLGLYELLCPLGAGGTGRRFSGILEWHDVR